MNGFSFIYKFIYSVSHQTSLISVHVSEMVTELGDRMINKTQCLFPEDSIL